MDENPQGVKFFGLKRTNIFIILQNSLTTAHFRFENLTELLHVALKL